MLLKILITLLIVLKNQKEPLTTTQIPFTMRGVMNIQKVISRAIYFHGKQGLALRGHRETLQESDENQNLGNFLTYLKELQNYCPELKEHLEAPQSKSVTYLSPTSQNEMIEVIGKKIILRDIVEEIKKIRLPQCFCRRSNF